MEKCIKCENEDMSVEYQAEGFNVAYTNNPSINKFRRNNTSYNYDKVITEHLIYTCKTCGYRHATKCKDSL